jgi:hypothetical protein
MNIVYAYYDIQALLVVAFRRKLFERPAIISCYYYHYSSSTIIICIFIIMLIIIFY